MKDYNVKINALQRYPAAVEYADSFRPVKNLGWLRRHWQSVSHFTIRTRIAEGELDGCWLIAWMKPGLAEKSYSTGWAMGGDCSHVLDWLRRPVFRGLTVYFDPAENASKPETCKPERVVVL